MEIEIKKRLDDILTAIIMIDDFTAGVKYLTDYSSNAIVKSAVERQLGILGEADVQIKKHAPSIQLSGMQKIISFRNFIIHAYDSINDDMVWIILKNHLPLLKSEVQKMLEE